MCLWLRFWSHWFWTCCCGFVLPTSSFKMFMWLKLCAFPTCWKPFVRIWSTPNHHGLEKVPVAKALVTSGLKNMLLWLMIDLCVPSNQIMIKLRIVAPSQLPDVCKFESDAVANGACVSCMESIWAHYSNAKSDPGCIHVAVAKLFADINLENLAVVTFLMT